MDNERLPLYTKSFQITIKLFCTYYFMKLIKDHYTMELKYI